MRRTDSSCESDQDTCDRIAKTHLHTRWKKWPNSTVKQILPYKNCSDSMKCLALSNSKCMVQRKRNSQQIYIATYIFCMSFSNTDVFFDCMHAACWDVVWIQSFSVVGMPVSFEDSFHPFNYRGGVVLLQRLSDHHTNTRVEDKLVAHPV